MATAHVRYDQLEPCDIIMKGGITSGVVYPGAVRKLSERYRFMGIGGTSAGAIAAAAAAAAEFGRRPGQGGDSFAGLDRLPVWLGTQNASGRSNLASLFVPQAKTRKVFATLLAAVSSPAASSATARGRLVAANAFRCYWTWTMLGGLPGLLVAALALAALAIEWSAAIALLLIPVLLIGIAVAVCGALLGAAAALTVDVFASLPENYFGLCTGGSELAPAAGDPLQRDPPGPLSVWLSDFLDKLAGLDGTRPLTFGDLWMGRIEPALGTNSRREAVRLNMITTDLTAGEARRLPFQPRQLNLGESEIDEQLYVREQDLHAFFPPRIVDHFRNHGETRQLWVSATRQETLLALPEPADVPVVFATRLSLSFPGLLSAFPIYVGGPNETAERHWFSDGGITSNFPAFFFDSPLPNWPTFGINLHPAPRDLVDIGDECENVTMWPETGVWRTDIASVGGFIGAIKDTMQNWHDNGQLTVPGFRERIAHIGFHRGEGGLNLYMPSGLIERLGARGSCAGDKLADTFYPRADATATTNWLRYRWTRYRSTFSVLEKWFALLHAADTYSWQAPEPSYRTLHTAPDLPDPFDPAAQAAFADQHAGALLDLAAGWGPNLPDSFQGAATPEPELRIVPRL
jgi:predicted acylesterase/phospholipase RssA